MTRSAAQTTPSRKTIELVLRVFLIAFITTESAMAKPKSEVITLDLSGTRISYASPVSYSKDFPRSPANAKTQYRINIHDQDLYKNQNTGAKNFHGIRKSYWDYGRGIIFGGVKGTLSMSVSLYRTSQPAFDAQDPEAFIKTLQADFELIYDKKARKDFKVILPKKYQMTTIASVPWVCYEFSIGGKRIVAYAYPLSDRNYFKVEFDFIINSEDQKDKWEQQVQATIDFIMASFEVK